MYSSYSNKDLRGLSFKNRDLENADFSNSDIRGCDFRNANLRNAVFRNVKSGHTIKQFILIIIFTLILLFVIIITVYTLTLLLISFLNIILNTNMSQKGIYEVSQFLAIILLIFVLPGTLYWLGNKIWWCFKLSSLEILLGLFCYSIWICFTTVIPKHVNEGNNLVVLFFGLIVVGIIILCFYIINAIIKLIITHTSGTSFVNADLSHAKFTNTVICGCNFSHAILSCIDWHNANLLDCKFNNNIFQDEKVINLLTSRKGVAKSYKFLDLRYSNLVNANLESANFQGSNLSGCDLHGANLENANLSATQALDTDFSDCKLTGAMLDKEWGIDANTNLSGIDCRYIYLNPTRERFPRGRNFKPGEFTKFFKKAINTVDLLFSDGVNWEAFAYSFNKLRIENNDQELAIQSIDDKNDGEIIVRVTIPKNLKRSEFEDAFWKDYEALEEYRNSLGEHRKILKEYRDFLRDLPEKIRIQIEKSMENQPKYNITNSRINIFENLGTYIENNNTVDVDSDTRKALDDLKQIITDLQNKHPQATTKQATEIIDVEFVEIKRSQPQRWQKILNLKRLWNGLKQGSIKAGEHFAEETPWGKAMIGFLEGLTDELD